MFEVFTVGAREVVVYAQDEARELGHAHIGTEHLLLGLLRDETDPTGQALRAAGVDRASVRAQLTELVGYAPAGKGDGHIPFTDRAKKVLTNALRLSQRLEQSHIGRPHLLYSLLDLRDGTAVRVLTERHVDVGALRTTAERLARDDVAGSAEERATARLTFTDKPPHRRRFGRWRHGG